MKRLAKRLPGAINAYGDSSPIYRDNEVSGVLGGGAGGGTCYIYISRPSTTGIISFINDLSLEGEIDADMFGTVIP